MKILSLIILFAVTFLFHYPVFAAQKSDDILKAIIKINATIPANARTAGSLGTEREGHGMVIDAEGHILTIGYLILEAETIKISTNDGRTVEASFVAYDHGTGFGIDFDNRF